MPQSPSQTSFYGAPSPSGAREIIGRWIFQTLSSRSSSFPGLGQPEARASGIDLYGFWPKLHMSGSTLSNININSFWNGS